MANIDRLILIITSPFWVPIALFAGFLFGPIWLYLWVKDNL